jgi:serine/threonine-protein kinase HipA
LNPNEPRHRLLSGKRDDFSMDDLKSVAATASMRRGRAVAITREVTDAVTRWPEFARKAGVTAEQVAVIGAVHRTGLVDS